MWTGKETVKLHSPSLSTPPRRHTRYVGFRWRFARSSSLLANVRDNGVSGAKGRQEKEPRNIREERSQPARLGGCYVKRSSQKTLPRRTGNELAVENCWRNGEPRYRALSLSLSLFRVLWNVLAERNIGSFSVSPASAHRVTNVCFITCVPRVATATLVKKRWSVFCVISRPRCLS